jgi:hypothetical protein
MNRHLLLQDGEDIFRSALHGQDQFWRGLKDNPELSRLYVVKFAENTNQLQQSFSAEFLSKSQLPRMLPPAPHKRESWLKPRKGGEAGAKVRAMTARELAEKFAQAQ